MSLKEEKEKLEAQLAEYRDYAEGKIDQLQDALDEYEAEVVGFFNKAKRWIKLNYQGIIAGIIIGGLLATGA